jgi:hypothetical protein
MKITVNQLRKIIKEEIEKNLGEVNVREEVKEIILSHENINKIAALLKDPTRTYESYSELMQPIINKIRDKYGDDGIAAYNSLIQTDLENLAFKYPRGYRSPIERPSEPEDVNNSKYLNTIDRKRGLYGLR